MNLNIETEKHETHYDVAVAGELDVATVPELEKVLVPIRQAGTHDIYVNLEVKLYGLNRFRTICWNFKSVKSARKELYILGVNDRIKRLFEITGLNDLMHVNEGTEVE